MAAPPRGGRGRGRGGPRGGPRGAAGAYGGGHQRYQHEYDPAGYGYDDGGYGQESYGYEDSYGAAGYSEGYDDSYGYDAAAYGSGAYGATSYEKPRGRGRGGAGAGGPGSGYAAPPDPRRGGPRGRGLGYPEYPAKPEKAPEEPTPPPPIVDGYAMPGMDAMPSTGIDTEKSSYKCYVCNIWTNTEIILNAHLGGKTHIKKLEQAGMNSFLPPEPLGPIPGVEALKEKKWETGEKRKFSEIDPSNKGHFTCEVCNLEFNSRVVYETHMQGKKHARMLKSIDEIKHQNVDVSCKVCHFVATSAVHLDAHLQGKNHKKRVEAVGKGIPGGTPAARPQADPAAPKMLAQMHKKPRTDGGPGGEYGAAAAHEEYGEEEYYDESCYGYEGQQGGGAHGTGAAGYYGY